MSHILESPQEGQPCASLLYAIEPPCGIMYLFSHCQPAKSRHLGGVKA